MRETPKAETVRPPRAQGYDNRVGRTQFARSVAYAFGAIEQRSGARDEKEGRASPPGPRDDGALRQRTIETRCVMVPEEVVRANR